MNPAGFPICPTCGNNHQVWVNQISGRLRCHRISCERDIPLQVERLKPMRTTITAHELKTFPTTEGVFVFYKGPSVIHYTCAFNLRRGIHTALASGWAPDRVLIAETAGGLSLERYLRRNKWDGHRLEDRVVLWEEWKARWGTPKDDDWEEKLAPGGKLTLKCPADPAGKKVWHRLARAQTKRLLAEVDKKKQP